MKKWVLGLFLFFSINLWGFCYGEGVEADWSGAAGIGLSVPEAAGLKGAFYIDQDGKYAYGAGLSLSRFLKAFPLEVKGGKLTVDGCLSLLNYPVLSSVVSPFYEGQKGIRKLSSSIPSSSANSTKPDSVYASFSLFNKRLNGAAFYDRNMDFGISSGGMLNFGRKSRFEVQFMGLFSPYEPVKALNLGWYVPEGFYKEGTMFSSAVQGAFIWNEFAFYIAWLLYSSPFGDFKYIFRSEISGSLGNGKVCFSAFYNPYHDVMTGGGRHYDETFQLKGNVFNTNKGGGKNPVVLKYGSAFFYQANLTGNTDVFKVNAGGRITGPSASCGMNLQGEFNVSFSDAEGISVEFSKGIVNIKTNWFSDFISPGIKMDFTVEPKENYKSWKFQESLGLQLAISNNPGFKLDGGVSLLQKDNAFSGGEITSALTMKYKSRFLTFNGKIGMSIEF